MSSSPAGASSNMPDANASVYTPTAQPAADQTLQNLIASFPSATGSPAGQYYPMAQDTLQKYITQSPYEKSMLDASTFAQGFDQNTAFPQATGQSTDLAGASWAGLPYGGTALKQGFDPQYTANVTGAVDNPYYSTAQTGAQQAAGIGARGADQLEAGATQTLNTAYDPQGRLYNQGRANSLDYSAVTNAMSGLGGTPYGSSVASNALSNYDLGWQDRQLGRQEKALGVADTTFGDASKLADTAAAYPSKTYTDYIDEISRTLGARNTGAATGGSTYSNILGSSGTADTTAAKLDSGALADYSTYGSLPYKSGVDVAKDQFAGVDSTVGLGNNQYLLPQQTVNDLESYLKLGQSSSTISGDLGKTGLGELSSAASGIGSTANTLFGTGGSSGTGSGGGLVGSIGNLFGGGGGAATSAGVDFGGGGAALGVADAGVGLSMADVAAAAPAAAAWIVCTELVRQGRMPRKYWAAGTRRFDAYSDWGKRGYYVWAVPAVRHLRRHPDSLLSRVLAMTFGWRAEHLAARAGVKGARRLWRGAAVAGGLALLCGVLGVFSERNWRAVYDTGS